MFRYYPEVSGLATIAVGGSGPGRQIVNGYPVTM